MAKSKKPEELAQDAQDVREEVTGKNEGMTADEIQRMEAENMARDAERAAQEERINYEGNPIPNPTPPADYVNPNAPKVPQPRVLAELFNPNGTIRVELFDSQQQGGSHDGLIQDLANRVISCETRLQNTSSKTNYAYEEIYGGGDRYLEDGAILDRTRRLERQVGSTGMDTKPLVERVEVLETAKDNVATKLEELEKQGGGSALLENGVIKDNFFPEVAETHMPLMLWARQTEERINGFESRFGSDLDRAKEDASEALHRVLSLDNNFISTGDVNPLGRLGLADESGKILEEILPESYKTLLENYKTLLARIEALEKKK